MLKPANSYLTDDQSGNGMLSYSKLKSNKNSPNRFPSIGNQYNSANKSNLIQQNDNKNPFWDKSKPALISKKNEYVRGAPRRSPKQDSSSLISDNSQYLVDAMGNPSAQRVSNIRKRINGVNPIGKKHNNTVVYNNEKEDAKRKVPYGNPKIETETVDSQSENKKILENPLDKSISIPDTPNKQVKLSQNNAQIDWARSILYWNIKSGSSNFNSERDTEIFYDFELDHIKILLKPNNSSELIKQEDLRILHGKARSTLKKLTTELLVGHIFYNLDSKCLDVFFIYIK